MIKQIANTKRTVDGKEMSQAFVKENVLKGLPILNGNNGNGKKSNRDAKSESAKNKMSDAQKTLVEKLLKSHVWTNEERTKSWR